MSCGASFHLKSTYMASHANDLVHRAAYFGYMSSISYVVALLGPALASATMSIMLWLPFWIGIALLLSCLPIIALLPNAGDGSLLRAREAPSSPLLKATESRRTLLRSIAKRFSRLFGIITTHSRNFTLLLFSFFLTSLASSDTKLLPQYISKRYEWLFASAGYLLSAKAVVNFTLLALVIPRLLHRQHVTNPKGSADTLNHRCALLCLAVSVIGAAAIGLAAEVWLLFPGMLIYALGSALPVFTLSLLKSSNVTRADVDDAGSETQVFSIVMLVKTSGSLLGAPLMAGLWMRGISLGGTALGIPYFVSAACYLAAIGVLSSMSLG
jgi:hypothetical protein